jgi:hypothetical protein
VAGIFPAFQHHGSSGHAIQEAMSDQKDISALLKKPTLALIISTL